MTGPVTHVSFDLVGAATILLTLLIFAAGLVLLTSWYWRRRFGRSSTSSEDSSVAQQLELLLNGLPEGLLLTDQNGRVLWCNPEARRLLSLSNTLPRIGDDLLPMVRRAADSGRSELRELHPVANAMLQVRVLPLAESDTSEDGILCIVSDISERRHQEEFYRHFVHNISHELLTPLAAVAGHIANVREMPSEEIGSRNASLAIMAREVERLTALTGNLLVLSRLESEVPLHLERTNVGAVAEQAVADLLGLAQKRGIEISIQGAPRLPRILADRNRLKQVFVNLVGNAIKHCPKGTTVQVRLRAEADSIVAEVVDDGPGIPPEDLPHIFEKLYRVQKEGTRATEGSGLGLSIVKRIVELHGGDVVAQSKMAEGTTFTFRLPLGEDNHP